MKLIKHPDAVGHVLCHDMTQIIKGEYKDARFRKGHVVRERTSRPAVHGQGAPVRLGDGSRWSTKMTRRSADAPSVPCEYGAQRGQEGKIELTAACDGLVPGGLPALVAVNSIEDIIMPPHGIPASGGDRLAGARVFPSVSWRRSSFAEEAAGPAPLLELLDVKGPAALGGHRSEVKSGMIQDTFYSVVRDSCDTHSRH